MNQSRAELHRSGQALILLVLLALDRICQQGAGQTGRIPAPSFGLNGQARRLVDNQSLIVFMQDGDGLAGSLGGDR